MSFIVAIDGPAGSGKGTVARKVAEKMGLTYIDTGAMYRCVTLAVLRREIAVEKKADIIDLLKEIKIELKQEKAFLNGEDVSKEIRTEQVSNLVSPVSSIKEVRDALVEMQREMGQNQDIIMEGRDITTVVFPNANIKIYLDAKVEERAKRRYQEYLEKKIQVDYQEVLENIKKRDKLDQEKEIGSLQIAKDAMIIDTTNCTIDEVVDKVTVIIEEKKGK